MLKNLIWNIPLMEMPKIPLEIRVVRADSPLTKAAPYYYLQYGTEVPNCKVVLLDRESGKVAAITNGVDRCSIQQVAGILAEERGCYSLSTERKHAKTYWHCEMASDDSIIILRLFKFNSFFELGTSKSWYETGRLYFHQNGECHFVTQSGKVILHGENIPYANKGMLESIMRNDYIRLFFINWLKTAKGTRIYKNVPSDIAATVANTGRNIEKYSSAYFHRFYYEYASYRDFAGQWRLAFDENRMYKFRYNEYKGIWVSTKTPLPEGLVIQKTGKTNTILDQFTANAINGYTLELGLKNPDIAKYSHVLKINGKIKIKQNISLEEMFGFSGKIMARAISELKINEINMEYFPLIHDIFREDKEESPLLTKAKWAILSACNREVARVWFTMEYKDIPNCKNYLISLQEKGYNKFHELTEYYYEYLPKAQKWEELMVERGYKSSPKEYPLHIKPSRLEDTIKKARTAALQYMQYCDREKNNAIDRKMALKAAREDVQTLAAYENEEFMFLVPTSSIELVREGTMLDHCVGRMGYNEKVANGKSIILFLREKKDIEQPFYTIELVETNKGYSMKQCYTYHDGIEKTPECKAFIDAWLKNFNIVNKAIY